MPDYNVTTKSVPETGTKSAALYDLDALTSPSRWSILKGAVNSAMSAYTQTHATAATDGLNLSITGGMYLTQVEFIKHLYAHLNTRYAANVDAPQLRAMFPKPSFKIVVLYVNEAVSIARQMARQTKSAIHNQKVREALAGNIMCAPPIRPQLLLCSLSIAAGRQPVDVPVYSHGVCLCGVALQGL